jgi:hypothetical protein
VNVPNQTLELVFDLGTLLLQLLNMLEHGQLLLLRQIKLLLHDLGLHILLLLELL